MNFIHTSDFHLGYYQYNLRERFKDLTRTFNSVIQYAHQNDVEFILISGDLFHKRNINAPTYLQAYKVLKRLKQLREESGKPDIPVYAIEGNHDLAYYGDVYSWLEILNAQGLLRLLKLKSSHDVKIMGDYVELEDVRIFGVRYLGASTPSEIPRIAQEIDRINKRYGKKYTILMMHFGIEGQPIREGAEVPYSSLVPLREVVDYLALGHYHIQYSVDNWIYNGGSIEILSASEADFNKGFYHVTDHAPKLVNIKTRPMKRFSLEISKLRTPDELYHAIESMLEEEKLDSEMRPMIDLTLYGNLNFPKSSISIQKLKNIVDASCSPLWCDVKIHRTDREYRISKSDVAGLTREQIELKVLSDMVKNDGRYREHVDEVTRTLMDVKRMTSAKADPESILKTLRASFERIT